MLSTTWVTNLRLSMLGSINDDCFSHHSAHLSWTKIVFIIGYSMAIMVNIFNRIARSSCTMQCQRQNLIQGWFSCWYQRFSVFAYFDFTALDGRSLVTPSSKDGFELISIAKKSYNSRSISSFDSMIWFGVVGHGTSDIMRYSCCKISDHDQCLYINGCPSGTDDNRGEFCAHWIHNLRLFVSKFDWLTVDQLITKSIF